MSTLIYLSACGVLLAASLYMAFALCYEDGIVGKLALIAISLGAIAAVSHWWLDRLVFQAQDVACLTGGLAVFICRHLARFWKYRHRKWENQS